MTSIVEQLVGLSGTSAAQPVSADDRDRLKDMAGRFEPLFKANAQLRSRALEQTAKIKRLNRVFSFANREMEMFQWRYYALCREIFGEPNPTTRPIAKIPPEMMDGYSMQGRAEIEYNYLDATYPNNWPLVYTDAEIDYFLSKIQRREYFIYGQTDVWMWEAIAKYPIRGKNVVNMGSLTPWYESNCLFFGASSTTIDYNKIITATSRIKTMTVAEWEESKPSFDVAWSISSFEHDGLGMYGDPLDTEGDIKAMKNMKRVVKPGGLLFLSLPVGRDKVLFNNARIYGKIRLPMLMEGWEKIDTIGLAPEHLDGPGHIQPVFILRNT